jgi:thymidylate synthase (FAD)
LQQPAPGQGFFPRLRKAARRREAREADRSLLPGARGTKVVAAVSTRAFIHLFERRASASADAKSDGFAIVLLNEVEELAPYLFGDYQIIRTPDNREVAVTPYWKV